MSIPTSPRKYFTENAISLFTSRFLIIPADQLHEDGVMPEEAAEVSKRCHIYLICRRAVCSIVPSSVSHKGGILEGEIELKRSGRRSSHRFKFPFPLLDGATKVEVAPYPHRKILTKNASGEDVRYVPASQIAFGIEELRNFEVLYVGQAYGDGRRTAIDRLRSHSTLQRILADTIAKRPDDEIMVFTFELCPYRLITSMDGTSIAEVSGERDSEHHDQILQTHLDERMQICLAEAGLIRYFDAPYNEMYRASFPREDQAILDKCYELDFSGLIVEIDTGEVDVSLYSKGRRPNTHHTATFDLHDQTERRSFFTFVDKAGRAFPMPGVIPPTS